MYQLWVSALVTVSFLLLCLHHTCAGLELEIGHPAITTVAVTGGNATGYSQPLYANLMHYGPLRGEGWNTRPMHTSDNITFNISLRNCVAGEEFMFVTPTPPLPNGPADAPIPNGPLNWKQGKIGVSSVLSLVPRNVSSGPNVQVMYEGRATLQPGAGAGRYPASGYLGLSLNTADMTMDWNMIVDNPSARVHLLHPDTGRYSEVDDQVRRIIAIEFSEVLEISSWAEALVLTNAQVQEVPVPVAAPAGVSIEEIALNPVTRQDHKSWLWIGSITAIQRSKLAEVRFQWQDITSRPASYLPLAASGQLLTGATWSADRTLRDSSGVLNASAYGDGASPGGWYVTPIHANYLPSTREMLFSGWVRRDGLPCRGVLGGPGGRRRAGITFTLDPLKLITGDDASSSGNQDIDIASTRIEEKGEYPFEARATRQQMSNPPLQDGDQFIDGDAMYCGGHTTLADGRVLWVGGARYSYMSGGHEHEWGLDYARLYDPSTRSITRVQQWRAPLGNAWYPTAARIPDGRVIVTGAFTGYAMKSCVGAYCSNPAINLFNVTAYDAGVDPWTVVVDREHGDNAIDPGIREYTRVIYLPQALQYAGYTRDAVLIGKAGIVLLLSLDPAVPMASRLVRVANAKRPGKCVDSSDQSSAVPIVVSPALPQGGLLVIGGCISDPDTMQRADRLNFATMQWDSIDTGIRRGIPASAWLPDGRILVVSGENPGLDQNTHPDDQHGPEVSPRHTTVIDPHSEQMKMWVETVGTRSTGGRTLDLFRGYHNNMALLHDGSVVIAGGFNQHGDVGCENPSVVLFRPSYLSLGPRPVVDAALLPRAPSIPYYPLLRLQPGERFFLPIANLFNVTLHPDPFRRAVLIAVQALTHSYGQNQRYIPLLGVAEEADAADVLGIRATVPQQRVAIPGHYHLFVLSAAGVPSESIHVVIGDTSNSNEIGPMRERKDWWERTFYGLPLYGILAAGAGVLVVVALSVILVIKKRRKSTAQALRGIGTDGDSRNLLAETDDLQA